MTRNIYPRVTDGQLEAWMQYAVRGHVMNHKSQSPTNPYYIIQVLILELQDTRRELVAAKERINRDW